MARSLGIAVVVLALLAPPVAASASPDSTGSSARDVARKGVPHLKVKKIATGLDHPWDVKALPGKRLLITQRDRDALTILQHGHLHDLRFDSSQIWNAVETGLLGLEVDPDFASNRTIYTCEGWKLGRGQHDVRVTSWTIDPAYTGATLKRTLVAGFPTGNGHHGGCRLLITRNGALNVGTGDAQQGKNPEDLGSLGGKTLRLNRDTGAPWPTNPFIGSSDPATRYITSYGHRNVQGLAQRADGSLWSIEQGTFRDDEVNRIRLGGDYGYNPVPGYNEQVPMTDQSLPGKQIRAAWRSGNPTLATSGGTFVPNTARWGALRGTLAVGVLKDERVLFIKLDHGRAVRTRVPAKLKRYGRIRTVVAAPHGDLLVTTDNGGGKDALLRVKPGR